MLINIILSIIFFISWGIYYRFNRNNSIAEKAFIINKIKIFPFIYKLDLICNNNHFKIFTYGAQNIDKCIYVLINNETNKIRPVRNAKIMLILSFFAFICFLCGLCMLF